MFCPQCNVSVHFKWKQFGPIQVFKEEAYFLYHDTCPNCNKLVIYLKLAKTHYLQNDIIEEDHEGFEIFLNELLIYPRSSRSFSSEHIPERFFKDFEESIKVISASPKASAALSRRILQMILRDEFMINKNTLSAQINQFLLLPGIPSHIFLAVDAVREIGNLAAHPTKDRSTGEIVDVEPGEAEWLIEVIEALFDFCFVQPKKLEERKIKLQEKLSRTREAR